MPFVRIIHLFPDLNHTSKGPLTYGWVFFSFSQIFSYMLHTEWIKKIIYRTWGRTNIPRKKIHPEDCVLLFILRKSLQSKKLKNEQWGRVGRMCFFEWIWMPHCNHDFVTFSLTIGKKNRKTYLFQMACSAFSYSAILIVWSHTSEPSGE